MPKFDQIEVSTEEARRAVEPEDLADVLQTLKGAGLITDFLIDTFILKILLKDRTRFDLALIILEAGALIPAALTSRRRH